MLDPYLVKILYLSQIKYIKNQRVIELSYNYSLDYLIENYSLLLTDIELQYFIKDKPNLDFVKDLELFLKKNRGVKVLNYFSDSYPKQLKEIPDPPLYLFVEGEIRESDRFSLAVVGSRKISNHGRYVTEKLTKDLCEAGFVIVSGMAYGADFVAQNYCVENGFRTIGVLGCGIDMNSNLPNIKLRKKILANDGAIISPYMPGTIAVPYNFPKRNRIISGLSLGVLVTEAREKSGSLITAKFALEQNREVFAVPNIAFSSSVAGTNQIIRDNYGKIVTSIDDILSEFPYLNFEKSKSEKSEKSLTKDQEKIYKLLKNDNLSPDQIKEQLNLSLSDILSILFDMELEGIVYKNGTLYSLKPV
ncbi:MAG: DNA-protecting protein DprA [Candidatus Cloacimonadota bacterium]|nr:MAG: DNA-protecting protein DprA [Candidatus Cloacimonadota bacterium]PIE78262.1 MAG: DNA-protecting protein DprA [Candidatus Delongbacteria bacterium]